MTASYTKWGLPRQLVPEFLDRLHGFDAWANQGFTIGELQSMVASASTVPVCVIVTGDFVRVALDISVGPDDALLVVVSGESSDIEMANMLLRPEGARTIQ